MAAHADDLRAEVAGKEGEELVRALRDDYRQAELSGADRRMLDYAMKLTRTPAAMTREDIEELRAAGFDDPAIHDIVQITGFSMGVNYGANKVRFPAPVMVGSRLRLGVKLLEVEDIAGGVQMVLEFTFECEGATKPNCVAEIIFRSYV